MSIFIAEARVRAVPPKGDPRLGAIGVGAPVQQPTGEYGCAVVLPPDFQPQVVYGEDSLQALSLAMRFMANQINDLLSQGYQFLYPDSDEAMPFGAYFMHPEWLARLEKLNGDTFA